MKMQMKRRGKENRVRERERRREKVRRCVTCVFFFSQSAFVLCVKKRSKCVDIDRAPDKLRGDLTYFFFSCRLSQRAARRTPTVRTRLNRVSSQNRRKKYTLLNQNFSSNNTYRNVHFLLLSFIPLIFINILIIILFTTEQCVA